MTVNKDSWEEEIDVSFAELTESSDETTDLVVHEVVTQSVVFNSLSYDEAREITERIRAASDVLYLLISKAHAGKAWEALNYSSFEEYVKSEFDISRSRAYQLINQANVVQAIEAASPDGTQVHITEAAARDLKNALEELAPQVRDATEGKTPGEAEDIIAGLVSDFRSDKKNAGDDDFNPEDLLGDFDGFGDSYDEELQADRADRDGFSASNMGGNMGGGGSGYDNSSFPVHSGGGGGSDEDLLLESLGIDPDDNADDEDEIDIDELLGIGNDPNGVRKRFESICNLYLALASLSKMPSSDELAPWVWAQENRRGQVEANLPVAIEWLQAFASDWSKQSSEDNTSSVDASLEEAYDEEITR